LKVSRLRFGPAAILAGLLIVICGSFVCAHPMVENGLDVVIRPNRITIDARISPEEILLEAGWPATQPATGQTVDWVRKHALYVRNHLKVRVDGHIVLATSVNATNPHAMDASTGAAAGSTLMPYRLEYPLPNPPGVVQIDQNFLREFNTWSASCILRIRQIDDTAFDTAMLTRERTAEFDCAWPGPTTRAVIESHPEVVQSKNGNAPALRREPQKTAVANMIIRDHLLMFVAAILLAGGLFFVLFWRASKNRT